MIAIGGKSADAGHTSKNRHHWFDAGSYVYVFVIS